MPANPQQLHDAIRQIGSGMAAASQSVMAARERALGQLRQAAADRDRTASAVSAAASVDPGLRCAVPVEEDLLAGYGCPAGISTPPLLAVDGSQIMADRHEEVPFAVINIASVILTPRTGRAPDVLTDTRILFGDQLYSATGDFMSEGDLSLARDAAERRSLLKHAPPVSDLVCLSDGPVELWGAKDASDSRAFERALQQYLEDLRELQRRGCTIAGYVDKPAADLVVRMLEVTQIEPALGPRQRLRTMRGATDRWLFAQLLDPGRRSAVLALQSSSRLRYAGDLGIHFFYLNVGSQSQPALARVEIPRWVAHDPGRVNALHQALLEQCALLAARPYPYILHRAHETASISMRESQHIKLRLMLEMRNHGLEPEAVSGKSSAKALTGFKRRY